MLKLSKLFSRYQPSNTQIKRTMTHKVFVYGTLKQNEPNHHWLTDVNHGVAKFLSNGITKQKYPLVIATQYNIPFLLHSPGNGNYIRGEVYEVDDKRLSHLDVLEDHPNFYEREYDEIYFVNKEGTKQKNFEKCWVYFLKKFRPELLSKKQFESYSSMGPHGLPYTERSKRHPDSDAKSEVKL